MNESLLYDVLERLTSRFYGKYRGVVTEVDEKTFRIKARLAGVLADQTTGWARPCVPFAGKNIGMAFLPAKGAGVWIEFEGGDVSYPIFSGYYWNDGQNPAEATAKVRAIITQGGAQILLSDDPQRITISDKAGNKIVLDSEGITISKGSQQVAVGDSSVSLNSGAFEVT
jgi:uncharacterized protein involved in type VI secretion and phage assembly